MGFSGTYLQRLAKELKDMLNNPEEGIKITVSEDTIAEVQAEYQGPASTPYEGGRFRMKLAFQPDYPASPPKGYFLTNIFHPNVSKAGEICVNTLKRDWSPTMGLRHILVVVRCLLIEPNPESALNEEAGKLLLEDYQEYFSRAQLMTSIHAQPQRRSMPLSAATGASAVNAQADHEAEPTHDSSGAAVAIKKPKGVEKQKVSNTRKRGLKRL